MIKRWWKWILWLAMLWSGTALCTYFMGYAKDRTVFLPGKTSHGHYQIELKCSECHTPWGGVKNDACNRCHAEELKEANDSHPKAKFADPRNASLLKKIDALHCVTCHREHHPEITNTMDVTMPMDYCVNCHADIADDRPSHKGMAFTTCATAGCHNFHDNTALYEDFVKKHLSKTLPEHRSVLVRSLKFPVDTPVVIQPDQPASVVADGKIITDWLGSAHARAGVNCADCHQAGDTKSAWVEKPDHTACNRCHAEEDKGFLGGHHGMRLAVGLGPMTPAMARIPMKPDSAKREISCTSCHGAHEVNTVTAAVESCLQCHDDPHSKAYLQSPHYKLWQDEVAGRAAPGTGVSCATCHLPRENHTEKGRDVVRVQHNQNANLRPNEKMIRTVCLDCHDYPSTLDALADPALIATNFQGNPAIHVDTVDMVIRRLSEKEKRKSTPAE